VLGRNRKALDDLVAAGVAHAAVIADVADQAAMNSALAEAALRQPIDILVANAGIAESAPFGKTDAVMFRRMLDVNFMGSFTPRKRCCGPWCSGGRAVSSRLPRRRIEGLFLCQRVLRGKARRRRPGPLARA